MKKILLVLFFLSGALGFLGTAQAAEEWCLTTDFKCLNKASLSTEQASKLCTPSKTFDNLDTCNAAIKIGEPTVGADGKGALSTQGNVVKLINPLGGSETNPQGEMNLPVLLGGIIKNVLGILGAVALLVFIYAGFQWVTAAGNSDKVSAGADAMLWSAIGICIIFSSYAILKLIFDTLLGAGALDGSNTNQANGPACYCTVNDQPNVAMTDPADGFTGPTQEAAKIACVKIQAKVTLPKSGKTIANCTWH